MRTNRALLVFIIAVLFLCAFTSCRSKDNKTPKDTTTSEAVELIPHDTALVDNPDWGYTAMSVGVSDQTIVSATLMDGGNVEIVSYNPGSAEVFVYDCFSHKAIINVTVADDEERTISYVAHPCTEEYIDAADFGVTSALADCSSQLQAAIDHAHSRGGGTVYLYPGIYHGKQICMKENVTLEMYSGVTDTTDGYTLDLHKATLRGEVTVLRNTHILNNANGAYGRTGASNFTVRGGVLDNSSMIFSLAKNVLIEDLVLKDKTGNHMVQITGCEDLVFKNCMFAGLDYSGFTYEAIQIEPSRPNAHGVHLFEEGEIVCPKNITVDGCYFGPSLKKPGPHIAIGHHGSAHEANCDGLKITNNVFDSCSYAAIRFSHIVDAEISGNKFTATKKSNKLCPETDPAFIILYSETSNITYENIVDKRTVTKALASEKSGTHNVSISNNEFTVEAGSDKKIIWVKGTNIVPGAVYKTNILRQDTYDSTPYILSGYFKSTNFVGNLSFEDNLITYTGQPTFTTYIFYFTNVYGLNFSSNKINLLNGCLFKNADNSIKGLYIKDCPEGKAANTYKIATLQSSRHISIPMADGTLTNMSAGGNYELKVIALTGGSIEIESTQSGNAIFSVIPKDGYEFTGWIDVNDKEFKPEKIYSITSDLTIQAVFKKKSSS